MKKKLSEIHRKLIQLRLERIREAQNLLQLRQREFLNDLDLIAMELGIPKEELSKWRLDSKNEYLERIESKLKIPKKKGG
jgi:DNA-directed RNA polymerase specialized sigma subunit